MLLSAATVDLKPGTAGVLSPTLTDPFAEGAVITRTRTDVSQVTASAENQIQAGAQLGGNGLQFNLVAAPGMSQQSIDGFKAAADLWSAILHDDVMININIDFTALGSGILGQTGSSSQGNSLTAVKSALATDATSLSDESAVANLPAGSALSILTSNPQTGLPVLDNNGSPNNTTLDINTANAKALGLRPANDSVSDGSISFSTSFTWDFDRTDGITAGSFDFIGVAAHEIGHLLGFVSGVDYVDFYSGDGSGAPLDLNPYAIVSPLDLFRYSNLSESVGADIDLRADTATKYFSINGGSTPLTIFSTGVQNGDGRQGSHWKDNLNIGIMDPTAAPGEYTDVTNFDVQAFDVMGFDVGMDFGDAPDTGAGTASGNYQTNESDDGPRHLLFSASGLITDTTGAPKVFLGAGVTGELSALQNATATGDADDGISSIPSLIPGTTQNFTVTSTGGGAVLDYFFDFNRDGDFADSGEAFSTALNANSQSVSVDVPLTANAGTTIARFRISTAGGLTAIGPANDGEVEDYEVTIENIPPQIAPQTLPVGNGSPDGTVVGTVIADDPDPTQTITYAITAGNTGNAFAIDPQTGSLTVQTSAAIDLLINPVFTLTVEVTDNGNPALSSSAPITINVLPTNIAPVVPPQTFNIPENVPIGTFVGNVIATDENAGQTRSYSIIAGNVGGTFVIDPATGNLTVANSTALNYEVNPTFSLTISVLDNGLPPRSGTGTITMTLSDANDPPKVTPKTLSVIEDAAVGTVVGTATATDEDPGQTRTFAITGGNVGNAFQIDASTGVITVKTKAAIDWEVTPVFSLQVTATDNGVPNAAGTGVIKVNVTNINDAPTGLSFANTTTNLAENVAKLNRVKVADIVIKDDGLGVNQLSLTGADASIFEIVGGGLFVKAGSDLNFEAKPTYAVIVNVDDTSLGNTPDASANFTLTLIDVNEAPVFPGKTVTLPENSPVGTVVATGIATDPDVGQQLTYSIQTGNRNGAFAINPATGVITVSNPAALDWENEPPYELKIAVTDNGAPAISTFAILKVVLTNANDAPSVYPAYKTIPENLAQGTVVLDYKIVAKDQDAGQTLTYAITAGNEGNAFAINPATGVITVNNPLELDYENQPPFELTISVKDNGSPSKTSLGSLRIALTDVNDVPRVYNGAVTIPENTPVGSTVLDYKIVARDQDVGQTLSFAILSGNRNDTFAIHPYTGVITVKNSAALDFETGGPFDLEIATTDTGTPALTSKANLRVNLKNVNDPPQFTNASVTILENLPTGTTVFDLKTVAKDPDAGQTLTFAITDGNRNNAFKVDAATGIVTVDNSLALDWENAPPFTLSISVADSANPALTATGTLKILLKDANDAPRVYNAAKTISENLPAGSLVLDYKIVASDRDAGQTLKYAITAGNTGNAFAIHPDTGLITVRNAAAVDFETNPQFVLTIKVTDNGIPALSSSATLTITLKDIAEAATVVPATFALPENSGVGTKVGTAVATTPPAPGKTRSFAITGGNPSNAFSINTTTGQIEVNNQSALNFEGTPTFSLVVTITDAGAVTTTGAGVIKVNLTNVNEAPVVPNQSLAVKTFAPVGTVVGTVAATDPDAGQTRTYAIESGNGAQNNIFAIDSATGKITVNNALGLFFARDYNLAIRVTDNGSPALSTVGNVRIVVNATGVALTAAPITSAPLTATSSKLLKKAK